MPGLRRRQRGKPAARLVVEGDGRRGSLDAGCLERVVVAEMVRRGNRSAERCVADGVHGKNRGPALAASVRHEGA